MAGSKRRLHAGRTTPLRLGRPSTRRIHSDHVQALTISKLLPQKRRCIYMDLQRHAGVEPEKCNLTSSSVASNAVSSRSETDVTAVYNDLR